MSSEGYMKAAIRDVESELEKADKRLVNKASTPMTPGYRPEMDQSHELNARHATYFHGPDRKIKVDCRIRTSRHYGRGFDVITSLGIATIWSFGTGPAYLRLPKEL
jgi:hypothetical protein